MFTLEQLMQMMQNGGLQGQEGENAFHDPYAGTYGDPLTNGGYDPNNPRTQALLRLKQQGLNPTERYNSIMGASQGGMNINRIAAILGRQGLMGRDSSSDWSALSQMTGQGYTDPVTRQRMGYAAKPVHRPPAQRNPNRNHLDSRMPAGMLPGGGYSSDLAPRAPVLNNNNGMPSIQPNHGQQNWIGPNKDGIYY